MAHLLGNKFYIESLQKDVGDLQSVVIEAFSRTGSITAPSWKYPEKLSRDLDVNELLDRYGYSADDEDCQVSHVILLELVIDRLLLVVQAFSSYTDQMLSMGRAPSNHSTPSHSVGLILKHYWNKLIQLHTLVKNLQTQTRQKTDVTHLDEFVRTLSVDSTEDVADIQDRVTWKKKQQSPISTDYNCKSSQTYETSFIPCDACDGAQFCLKQAGTAVAEMSNSQNIQSNVQKLIHKYQDTWMSVQDMKLWFTEQGKDLDQLNEQLNTKTCKLKDAEARLEMSQVQNNKYRSELQSVRKELKQQKEDMTITRKQYERKIQDIKTKWQEEVAGLERKNGALVRTETSLQVGIADLQAQLDQKHHVITNMENSKQKLVEDLARNKTDQQEVKKSHKYVEILEKELKELHLKLEESSRHTARLEAQHKSSHRQVESMKTKQTSLTDQIERLERENEDLKHELADLEAQKEELASNLESTNLNLADLDEKRNEEKLMLETLTRENSDLKSRVRSMEDNVLNMELQVNKCKEQERLLIEYPDLNGPIEFEGTGDVVRDMENQIRANSLRIDVLHTENQTLTNSVRKIVTSLTRNTSRNDSIGSSVSEQKQINTHVSESDNIPKLQLWR